MKQAKKAKVKKRQRKVETIRIYLKDVNHHIAQLTGALRTLADKLDNVRSYHLED